jgi:hypothetical protein
MSDKPKKSRATPMGEVQPGSFGRITSAEGRRSTRQVKVVSGRVPLRAKRGEFIGRSRHSS